MSLNTPQNTTLPPVLAGPIVRKASRAKLTFWLVSSSNTDMSVTVSGPDGEQTFDKSTEQFKQLTIQVGKYAFVNLLHISPDDDFPEDVRLSYDIQLNAGTEAAVSVKDVVADLLYPDQDAPSFVIRSTLSNILHGSCRKPHFDSEDGLLRVDEQLALSVAGKTPQPDLLMMSGDQVYADDIAGPTLIAIHQTISLLGLFPESLQGAIVADSEALFAHPYCYYQRPLLLPDVPGTENIYSKFFAAKRKPIFTSVNANNHIVTFAETMAMYILTWSPEMWQRVTITDDRIAEQFKPKFAEEKAIIERFASGLCKVRRALAHITVYMIFDDHDVTDDWNLTRGWEEAIYNNPFAKRIVGNALAGYWLCQGWGNEVDKFSALYDSAQKTFTSKGIEGQDEFIGELYAWNQWHYHLDTQPKFLVLDTRTQRWRSESSLSKPSGLMDWEALCDLQQELIGQQSVIMVSAAPVFGVKLIETIQRIFTFFGKALTVDAENWMAHKGTASVMLNIFRHYKTPPHFVILSGDVHYSFVYDITLRFRRNSPRITQITCSGIKNQFPDKLLRWFDRLNRVLYGRRSPLNWFTQRRKMVVKHRRPGSNKVDTLLNQSGVGQLHIEPDCKNVTASVLVASGENVEFKRAKKQD